MSGATLALASIDIDLEGDFESHLRTLEPQLDSLAERAPWLLDLIAREPSLYEQPRLRKGDLSTVEVVVDANP